MTHKTAPPGDRVLICAPFGRDAESLAQLLSREGYSACIRADLEEIASSLGEPVGVVLLTEETLAGDNESLRASLKLQPDWSDIPFVLLAARRKPQARVIEEARARLWTLFTNAIVIERPLSTKSLLSAIDSAMRARQKQFEMRNRLAERDRAREALAQSEARLRLATDAAEIGFWDVDPVTDKLIWPPLVKAMFGISPDVAVTMADFYSGLHPDDAPATVEAYQGRLRSGAPLAV